MTSDMRKDLIFAHRTNIDRYRRILKSCLAPNERLFIEQRLNEEEKALLEVVQTHALVDCCE